MILGRPPEIFMTRDSKISLRERPHKIFEFGFYKYFAPNGARPSSHEVGFGGGVLFDGGAAEFVSFQHAEWRGVDVNRD